MLDHISITVSDLALSKDFYLTALRSIGYGLVMEFEGVVGLGAEGKPDLWLAVRGSVTSNVHIAFTATERAQVDEFHAAAIEAGGKDNGGPGLRPHYTPTYYGAFVTDPDGNNLEVVCHTAVEGEEKESKEGKADDSEENPTKKRKTEDAAE